MLSNGVPENASAPISFTPFVISTFTRSGQSLKAAFPILAPFSNVMDCTKLSSNAESPIKSISLAIVRVVTFLTPLNASLAMPAIVLELSARNKLESTQYKGPLMETGTFLGFLRSLGTYTSSPVSRTEIPISSISVPPPNTWSQKNCVRSVSFV